MICHIRRASAYTANRAVCRHFSGVLMCRKNLCKLLSISALSFGLGILVSFFIPEGVLVVMEALLIMAVGVLCFFEK